MTRLGFEAIIGVNSPKEDDEMLFNRRDLTRILVPLFIEQILAVTIGMFDSMMVSSAGEAAVSGVALVDTVNILLSNIFAALATGGAVVCSQFLGRKDIVSARKSAKQLLYSVFAVSFIIMCFAIFFRKPLLSIIFGKVEADVMSNAVIYFLFTALSYPFLALFNGGAALFRSIGNSKISMIVSVVMNVVNVAGNAVLIYIFHLGAAGAAIATLISRILGAFIIIRLLLNKNTPIYIEKLFEFKPDFSIIKRILGIGIPNGLENGMFHFGKILTQSLISTFGTATIAANTVAVTVANFQYAIGGAVGLSLITIVGRCVGAGEKEQAKQYTKKLIVMEHIFIIFISVIVVLLSKVIIGAYNLSDEGSIIAFNLITFHSIFVSTIWPVAFTLPSTFRAASDVKYPMVVSVFSMWLFRVAFSYILANGFGMGIYGVWTAMMLDWIFRAILFVTHYIRGKWLTKYAE